MDILNLHFKLFLVGFGGDWVRADFPRILSETLTETDNLTIPEYSNRVSIYFFAEQEDHAHELVTAVYRASIWSFAALFSERVGINART